MQSITELLVSISDLLATADIITEKTMEAASGILAEAPGLYNIQIGDTYINGYYFNVQTDDEVDVLQDDVSGSVYTATTSKAVDDFCSVTIIPCLELDGTTVGQCNADKWCGDEPTPTKKNDWSQAIRGELAAIFAH